ncbi:MAG: SlyX family protein [Pseudomonadales bacterium]|nr:SlyX family protein [Pseudomonadales bacterium]
MHDSRLVDIETKVAYQEDTVQALNDALCQQQRRLDQLELQLKLLVEKISDIAVGREGSKQEQEIPPHY